MSYRVVVGAVLASVLGLGCAGSQARRVEDARMAEIEARERDQLAKIDARTSSVANQAEQVGEQRQEAVEATDQPGSDARAELVEISGEREQYRIEAQGRLAKLTVRLEAVKEKSDVLGPRAPTSLQQDIETAQTERRLIEQRVAELSGVEPARWGENKSDLEQSMRTLGEHIDRLNTAIGDV